MNLDDFKIRIGELQRGKYNNLCDVEGIKVGHVNIDEVGVHTGVSAVLISEKNPYLKPLNAGVYVLNGFGKSAGLMQVEELGEIESHIILTNTLGVGNAMEGLVCWNIEDLKNCGVDLKSFNAVVCECNDSKHNDISKRSVRPEHVNLAIEDALNGSFDFKQGSVGAGRGMTCHGLKGGIGSSSRVFQLGENNYTMAALVLSNYGAMRDLTIDGNNVGKQIVKMEQQRKKQVLRDEAADVDKGSIIMIMATDMPLTSRQIKRVLKRGAVGLARMGSHLGNGSGDVLLGFSTANVRDREIYCKTGELSDIKECEFTFINDSKLDIVFRAFAECVEEAILNSLFYAEPIEMSEEEKLLYPNKSYANSLSELLKDYKL